MASQKKREKAKIQLALEHKIRKLEIAYTQHPSPYLRKAIQDTRLELNVLLSHKTERALAWTQATYYRYANKPGKLLARKLREKQTINTIHKIKPQRGQITSNPDKMYKTFHQYYQNLYKHQQAETENIATEFFSQLNLPHLSESGLLDLNALIIDEDTDWAIKRLKRGILMLNACIHMICHQWLISGVSTSGTLNYWEYRSSSLKFKGVVERAEKAKLLFGLAKSGLNTSNVYDDYTNSQTSGTCLKFIRMDLFVHYSLIPAVFITITLSYLQRKAKHDRTIGKIPLGKRFGIVVPVNFISSYSNRWSYGAACGATATTVFQLFFHEYSNYFNFTAPTWAKALVYLLSALEVGMDYYPFFACLSTNHRLVGSTLGFCYSLCWFCVQLANILQCQGFGHDSIILVFTPVPSLACCLFLTGRFLQLFIVAALSLYRKMERKEEEEPLLPQHLTNYVRHLLQSAPEMNERNPSQRCKIYKWDTHFKFPTRMIVTAVLCLICLYNFVLVDFFMSPKAVKGLDSWILDTVNLSFSNETRGVLLLLKDCWFYSTFPSACTSIIFVLHVLSSYRKEMKRLYKGVSEIPSVGRPAVVLAASIRYTGNQIAYLLWGYFLLHIMFFLISLIITFWFVVPIKEGKGMIVLQIFGYALLGIVIMIAVIVAQILAAQFFFLQEKISPNDKNKPLAIDNRRGFQNFSYFFMFYSVVLGFGACLVRILFNVLLGSWLLARIDHPLFPKGYEGADMGYNTWTGMLQVDLYHTHPIVLSFCHMLTQDARSIKHRTGQDVHQDCRNKQRRTKWHLAYTLIKNPTLILYRKPSACDSTSYPLNKDVLRQLLIIALRSPDNKCILMEKDMENSANTSQL
ncbi:stimulated by retinoic acid gene 6 protein-like [Eleutherodactylus coqui]|uniref:stimulated by retinoic acid gene 6 protein-like n=1 Tax=Eleutherodactylus coqui TaxID=57060 RepID=UPI0034638223